MTDIEQRSERIFRAIEAMLNHRHPRQDNKAIVDTLRSRFGAAQPMLEAEPFLLERSGLHPHDALMISQLPHLARLFEQDSFKKYPYLARLQLASKYLLALHRHLRVERFYMTCLNSRGQLKEKVLLQEGTDNSALFSLPQLMKHVIRISPRAVILSHNHPGGTLRPSKFDILCTQEAMCALTAVGIPMLDHLIVTDSAAVSLRQNGFIPSEHWLNQNPQDPFLTKWLEEDKDPAINYVSTL